MAVNLDLEFRAHSRSLLILKYPRYESGRLLSSELAMTWEKGILLFDRGHYVPHQNPAYYTGSHNEHEDHLCHRQRQKCNCSEHRCGEDIDCQSAKFEKEPG
jgi:hypothetical protein